MRKLRFCLLMAVGMLFAFSANAGGGSVGLVPATGVKIMFGNGGSSTFIPFKFEGEAYLGSESKHGVGGRLGYDIGVGKFALGSFSLSPEYKYYFNGGTSSSPFVGAYTDFRFRSLFSIIGLGAQGGYQHYFDNGIGIYGAGSFGFATAGSNGYRNSGGEFGIRAGVKYAFGR